MYLGCHDTYIQFPSEGTLQIYMRITSSCISKREIRTDDTADLAYRHGSFKNNGEDRGIGWRVCSDLRVRKNFEIVLWEERRGGPACFVSLFVSTRVCTRGIPKGTKERVETAGAPRHATPKNRRDSAVFCEQALQARIISSRRATRRKQFPLPRRAVSFIGKPPT